MILRAARQAVSRRSLVAALLAALILRAVVAWVSGPVGPQEIRYITLARSIVSGQGYQGLDTRFPDIIQPPLFPLMVAFCLLLPGPEVALSRAASIVMGALTVLPLFLLTRRLFGARVARRAVVLLAFYPLLVVMSSAALTESSFAFLVSTAAVVLLGVAGPGGGSPRAGWIVGVLLGLAFLLRPEALTYAAAAAVILLVARFRAGGPARARAAAACAAPVILGVLIFATPYLAWVRYETGRWLLAPKAVLFQVYEKIRAEGARQGWTEPPGSVVLHERVRFGLNEARTGILADEEFAAVSFGLGGGITVSRAEGVWLSAPAAMAADVARSLKELYLDLLKQGLVAPLPLLMLGGVGLLSRPWVGRFRRKALALALFVAGGSSFLLAPINPRFLYASVVLLLPWVARGWAVAEDCAFRSLTRGAGGSPAAWPKRTARAAIGAFLVAVMLAHLWPAARESAGRYTAHREAGLWLRQEAGPGRRVIAEIPVVSYYAGALSEVLPYASIEDVLHFARSRRAEYLVVDTEGVTRNRPQLHDLLNPWSRHPGLELVRSFRQGRISAVHVYKVTGSSDG